MDTFKLFFCICAELKIAGTSDGDPANSIFIKNA